MEHCDTLRELASQCSIVVEFGVRDPDETSSTMSLLRGTQDSLISYDIHSCNLVRPLREATAWDKNFEFRLESSLTANIPSCDLLMIDSKHTYEQLSAELKQHHSKVKKFIVCHDTDLYGHAGEDGSRPGLWDAVVDFLREHHEWRMKIHYSNCCGLSVLERKDVGLSDLRAA